LEHDCHQLHVARRVVKVVEHHLNVRLR
jgi:hypothetical protein